MANGVIEKGDDGIGTIAGTFPSEGTTILPKKKQSIDITAAFKKNITSKHKFIGLRLETAPDAQMECAWRLRSADFAHKHGKQFSPTLLITLK